MPLISIILFFVLCVLLFLIVDGMKRRQKLVSVRRYGKDQFDIDLPSSAMMKSLKASHKLPHFMAQSDAEGFYALVTPYLGSLSVVKRAYLYQSINDLKNDLKINKDIYQYFLDEYKVYEGLDDDQAAKKWSGQS